MVFEKSLSSIDNRITRRTIEGKFFYMIRADITNRIVWLMKDLGRSEGLDDSKKGEISEAVNHYFYAAWHELLEKRRFQILDKIKSLGLQKATQKNKTTDIIPSGHSPEELAQTKKDIHRMYKILMENGKFSQEHGEERLFIANSVSHILEKLGIKGIKTNKEGKTQLIGK